MLRIALAAMSVVLIGQTTSAIATSAIAAVSDDSRITIVLDDIHEGARVGGSAGSSDLIASIRGSVIDHQSGIWVDFDARESTDSIFGYIRDKSGNTLIAYEEIEQLSVVQSRTGSSGSEYLPRLYFMGVDYSISSDLSWEMMESVATSESGPLIRHLAMFISFHIPEIRLQNLRRALQVPFQAMQSLYDYSLAESPTESSLETALHNLQRRAASTGVLRETLEKELALSKHPVDCRFSECEVISTSDYIFSINGGYVNRTLSPQLILSHSYESNAPVIDKESLNSVEYKKQDTQIQFNVRLNLDNPILPYSLTPRSLAWADDEAGHCLGRCGAGCGRWSCSRYNYSRRRNLRTVCDYRTNYVVREYWEQDHTAYCTTSGLVTDYCLCHDQCARSSSHLDPACVVSCAGQGVARRRRTWTAGPRRITSTGWSDTAETCWYE